MERLKHRDRVVVQICGSGMLLGCLLSEFPASLLLALNTGAGVGGGEVTLIPFSDG